MDRSNRDRRPGLFLHATSYATTGFYASGSPKLIN